MYTAGRIGKLILFYFCFYSGLALFTAILWYMYQRNLDDHAPKLQLEESLIGGPRLVIKPPFGPAYIALIKYNSKTNESIGFYTEQLDNFLSPYYENRESETVQFCEAANQPEPGRICGFKVDQRFAPCTKEYNYGFGYGGLCIFLKLNKVYGWTPDCYDTMTMPDQISDGLKHFIHYMETSRRPSLIWTECYGRSAVDKENIGPMTYFPTRGFEQKYFPYTNDKGYLSPLVAVHFEKPAHGVLINVECKVWARNLGQNNMEDRGSARFRLLID